MDFYDRYVDFYGFAPDFFAAVGADWLIVLQAAMDEAGGADDPEAVREALQSLTDVVTLEGLQSYTPDRTYEGVTGYLVEYQISVDDAGDGVFEFVRTLN